MYTEAEWLQMIVPRNAEEAKTWSIKSLKMLELSNGVCWKADLYQNGKPVGSVENYGRGGSNFYYFSDKEVEKSFENFVKDNYSDNDLDNFVEYLITILESKK